MCKNEKAGGLALNSAKDFKPEFKNSTFESWPVFSQKCPPCTVLVCTLSA